MLILYRHYLEIVNHKGTIVPLIFGANKIAEL